MISLRLLLLVLLTLGCREWAELNRQVVPMWAGLAVLGVSLGFGLLFKVSVLRVLSSDLVAACEDQSSGNAGGLGAVRRCERARNWVETAWIVVLPLALLATGWGPVLNSLQAAGLPQVVAVLGWFLPSLVLIMLLELTTAQLDELCHNRAAARSSWPREWLLRMRLGQMASLVTCLTPLLFIAAVTDLVQAYGLNVHASWIVLAATVIAIGCVVLFLPMWLGTWMGVTEFPEGQMRRRIENQLNGLRLHGIGLRVLRSEGRWPGAAIVGWFPRFRQLWLGDALIERLTPQQLDMVIMHELAHVTGRHFLWRVFPMLWAGGVAVLFGAFWPPTEELRLVGLLIGGAVACTIMLFGMSLMAHQCELEADLSACRLAEQVCDWTRTAAVSEQAAFEPAGNSSAHTLSPQLRAGRELAGALICLLGDSPQAAAVSWLHPSLAHRLKNLRYRRLPVN